MAKKTRVYRILVALTLVFCMSLFTACGNEESVQPTSESTSETSSDVTPVRAVEITAKADAYSLKVGDTTRITVTVTNTENIGYTLKSSDESILSVSSSGLVEVIKDPDYTTHVEVIATANADKSKTAKVEFKINSTKVTPGQINGANGSKLTSEMIAALGNESITVNGTIEDIYDVYSTSGIESSQVYEYEVKMQPDKWYGYWKAIEEDGEEIEGAEPMANYYQRGSEMVVTQVEDEYGTASKAEGYPLQELYINKNNEVVAENVTDYISRATLWTNQHLWNHLGELVSDGSWTNRAEYNEEDDVYIYTANLNSNEWYLMAYLAFSFTPILSGADAFSSLEFYVENGEITKIIAFSEVSNYYDENDEVIAGEYTVATLYFSNVGTTVVPAPAAYTISEDETAEYAALASALEKMQSASSYYFKTTDVTTYAVSADDDDYSISTESVNKGEVYALSKTSPAEFAYANTSSGTVGLEGYVTESGIYLVKTDKYTYTMDGNAYWKAVTGYRQFDGYYEYFEPTFNNDANRYFFEGKIRTYGTLKEKVMPNFDFLPEIFEYRGTTKVAGANMYQFALRSSKITAEVAKQISMYSYAKDATALANAVLTITVTKNGELYSTSYPYDISGNYRGICTTIYSNIDDTEINSAVFSADNYVSKQYSFNWADYKVKYYDYYHEYEDEQGNKKHNWLRDENKTAAEVIQEIAADRHNNFASDMPSAEFLYNAFGNFYGPFFEYSSTLTTDVGGFTYYKKWLEVTCSTDKCDANSQISTEVFMEILNGIIDDLAAEGFTLDLDNSRLDGGTTGRQTNYATFSKGDVMIVVENNFTKNFWISFYVNGDWSL